MIWSQTNFQDSSSSIMTALSNFHDLTLLPITFIIIYVITIISFLTISSNSANMSYESHELEIGWTFLPIFILVFLALPSLRLLYLVEETPTSTSITLKTTGHQWYWSYDYADFRNLEFDSYITPSEYLNSGEIRLLETDNRVILPFKTYTRILVTAADVLHSWTVPSIGVKADAVPGRLNQLSIFPMTPGIFYGQCSEICGANHSFMPISLEIVNLPTFAKWVIINNNE